LIATPPLKFEKSAKPDWSLTPSVQVQPGPNQRAGSPFPESKKFTVHLDILPFVIKIYFVLEVVERIIRRARQFKEIKRARVENEFMLFFAPVFSSSLLPPTCWRHASRRLRLSPLAMAQR